MLSVKLIINPNARKVRNDIFILSRLTQKLSQYNVLSEVIYTTKDARDKKMLLHNLESRDAIIVFGGDGTVNRVVSYLIDAAIYKPILVMPGGTANVFCLEKNLKFNVDEIAKLLLGGRRTPTDIGFVEYDEGIKYFLLMVGIGLDAQAINEVDVNVKKLFGKATYLFSGAKNFMSYKSKQIIVEYNSELIKDIHSVVISNSRLYGGNIELFPEADMHDGFLDMCAFFPANNFELLRAFVNIQSGRHESSKDIKFKKIEEAYISSHSGSGKIPFQVDGEFAGYLPINVGILKNKIEFILP